ncbi:MAG: diphthamide biosynthesis enzyme Dph2 [Candidatus Diapherotrites archaeon]
MIKPEFSIESTINAILQKKPKILLLQFPEGLKTETVKIAREIEKKTGTKTVSIIEPCYGACDLPLQEMKTLKADLAIHFGHTQFMKSKKILYVPLNYPLKKTILKKLVLALSGKLKEKEFKRIGLLSTAQFLKWLPATKKMLEENGFTVLISNSGSMRKGQVLGCNTMAAKRIATKTDCFVFVGDGQFHPLGIAYNTNKPVFALNPFAENISEVSEREIDRRERAHLARIEIAKQAKSFGILVSTKPGQMALKKALELKSLAEKRRKKALILASSEIREEFVLGLGLECFVNTACPRLSIDDAPHWKKLLVSAEEMREALE